MKIAILSALACALSLPLLSSCDSKSAPEAGSKKSEGKNVLRFKMNGTAWSADSSFLGIFHPPGYNKAILIGGSKGPKDKDEQVFNLNLYNADGPGTYHIRSGNTDLSVVQLANLSPENFLYGSTLGFDLKVVVTKASATGIEATFEGTLSGNASDVLTITEGTFSYHE